MNSYRNTGYNGNSCPNDCNERSNECGAVTGCVSNARCGAPACGVRAVSRSRCVCGICSLKAAALFAILLALALGLIFGTVYAETFFPALAAIIVFAVIMAVAVIALLIYRGCEC